MSVHPASSESLTREAIRRRVACRYAARPIEAALQRDRALTEGAGAEGHSADDFGSAEGVHRAGSKGVQISESPLLAENLAGLSRLPTVDRAGRTHLRLWAEEQGLLRDDADKDAPDLSNFAKGQAHTKTDEYERACKARLMESWSWILVPTQPEPTKAGIVWDDHAAGGDDAPAPKVSQKLVGQDNLLPTLGASRLKMELDRHLWRDTPHVGLKHVEDCFSTNLYLPRLTRHEVLLKAVQNAFAGTLLCEYFGYAMSFDAEHGRYAGLQTNRLTTSVQADGLSVLVKPALATAQVEADWAKEQELVKILEEVSKTPEGLAGGNGGVVVNPPPPDPPSERTKTLYFGSKSVNPSRAAIGFWDIQEETIKHFSAKYRAEVTVTMEINAKYPAGFDAGVNPHGERKRKRAEAGRVRVCGVRGVLQL